MLWGAFMKEQELYKEMLKKMIDQTKKNNIQTVDQLIQELIMEINSHFPISHQKAKIEINHL